MSRSSATVRDAILLTLRNDPKTRVLVLAVFEPRERSEAGDVLDALVAAGDVAFDGEFYRLQVQP